MFFKNVLLIGAWNVIVGYNNLLHRDFLIYAILGRVKRQNSKIYTSLD